MVLRDLDVMIERRRLELAKLERIREELVAIDAEQTPGKRRASAKGKKAARVSSAQRPPKAGAKAGRKQGATRIKASEYVRAHPKAEIPEIAEALGLVRSVVSYHLRALRAA